MRIRVEGYNPTMITKDKAHSDYHQYHTFESLCYGPIHEEGELSREEMIKEFLEQYPDFAEEDCRIIKVGEERKVNEQESV